MSMPSKRFSIALSFPGEHRGFVEQVAAALSTQIDRARVLYDKYYEAEFARPDLDTYLQRLYHDESELIAIFLCADYERKEWCGLEWRAIRDLIKKRQTSSVMPLRFDTTEIPGLFSTDGYVWIDGRSPLEIAAIILKRLEINAISVTVPKSIIVSAADPLEAVPIKTVQPVSISPADYNPANRFFNVPFRPKGDQVIGRAAALDQVRVQLTNGKRTAIGHTAAFEGLGGLGKTQLAVEYAYLFRESYPNGVIWINADQDINAQLTDIAVTAHWIAPETEHKLKLDVALHRLRSFSDCLIIFDNVDDYAAIDPFLPMPTATPHLLATSRSALTGFKEIPLNQLDEDESLQLLFQEAGRHAIGDVEKDAAKNIVEQLDGLPLALELAGAYLCHRSTMSFAQYRDKLLSDPINTLSNSYLYSFTKHDADLFRTLKIDEDVVLDEPWLAEILDVLTWSGPAAMGLSLMSRLLDMKESELSGALALGVQLKLLQKKPDEERYTLHRLVREVRRIEKPIDGRNSWINQVCEKLGDWFEELREDFLQLPRFEAEIDHLVTWCKNAEYGTPLHACRLTWLQAYPAYHRGLYLDSHGLVMKAREIFEKASLIDNKLLAHLLNDLSTTHSWIGQHSLALDFAEQALHIRLDILREVNEDTALTYNNLGNIHSRLSNPRKALEYLTKSLDIYRQLFGELNFQTARAYNNVGNIFRQLKNYKEALRYQEKALEICRQIFGERHPQTASTYNDAGLTYVETCDNSKAQTYLEIALRIRLELFAERHPDTAISFNSVGDFYGLIGDVPKGLGFQEKALAINIELLGEHHSETATTLGNIGGNYSRIGNNLKALEYQMKAMGLRHDILGDHHPDTITSHINLGIVFENLGKYEESIRVFNKGYALAKEILPNKHHLLDQFEKCRRNVMAKMVGHGFRSKPIQLKAKKRKKS